MQECHCDQVLAPTGETLQLSTTLRPVRLIEEASAVVATHSNMEAR